MNKGQMDRWFRLSDRLTTLKNRCVVNDDDIRQVLPSIQELDRHANPEQALCVAEMTIHHAEQSGILPGSDTNLNALPQERIDRIVQKGIDSRRKRQSGETKVYASVKVTRIS